MSDIDDIIRAMIANNEEKAREILMQQHRNRVNAILEKSGIGRRFQKRTFKNFEITDQNREAFNKAFEFAKSFPNVQKGLLFTGNVGVGKTHLAAAIANELIERLHIVMFGNITDIISLVKSTYRKDSDISEIDIINTITEDIDLLALDDLGKEYASENTRTVLYQIINRLYENEKPIVITTNLSGDILARKLGEKGQAIVSRITEMCEPVFCTGDDWRLKNGR